MDEEYIMVTAMGIHYDDGGSVVIFEGIEDETGDVIRFGVDQRHAYALYQACANGESPVVAVPEWSLIRRIPASA